MQPTGFYWAGFLSLILGVLKLTVETHWSWWRVLLPVWAFLGHGIVYIGVGLLWLSFFDDGGTDERDIIREANHPYCYQLAALLCFAMFTDNVLRRIEGAGQTGVLAEFGQMGVDRCIRDP